MNRALLDIRQHQGNLSDHVKVYRLLCHTYVSFIFSLAKHCRRSPDLLGHEDIRGWLYHLIAERKQAASTASTVNTITQYDAQIREYAPVYYWRFNETNGSGLAYECYNRLDARYGTSTTNAVAGVPDPPFYGFETNNASVAMKTTATAGGAGYVTAPAMNLNTNAVSIVAWLYPFGPVTNSAGVVFSRGSTYAVGLSYLGGTRIPPNEIGYTWNQNNSNTYNWPSRMFTPPGQWSFVVLTVAPTQAIIYVGTNSTLNSFTNVIAHTVELWDGPTAIGADTLSGPSRVFNGKVDEVAVFNYTLSPAQVAALYSVALLGGPVTLSCQRSGADLVLTWPRGTLLHATDPNGPWSPVPGAAPPSLTVAPTGPAFYRVQVFP